MSNDIIPKCQIEDCKFRRHARGWCKKHYMNWYHTGDPLGKRTRGTPEDGNRKNFDCIICGAPAIAREWCQKHYYNWYYHGDPLWTIPPRNCRKCGKEFTPEKDTRQHICEFCKVTTAKASRDAELHLPKGQRIALLQNSVCAICGRGPNEGFNLVIDHDHETGEIREPLCGPHNSGLGFFEDDPEMLRLAADYIERHREAQLIKESA